MANYTAADVKALREKSGAGMMDCKGALDEANGDIEKAFELLRLKGLKGVSKREGRTTSNGLVVARVAGGKGTLIELACETDFVAKAENFVALADQVADAVVAAGAESVEAGLTACTPSQKEIAESGTALARQLPSGESLSSASGPMTATRASLSSGSRSSAFLRRTMERRAISRAAWWCSAFSRLSDSRVSSL